MPIPKPPLPSADATGYRRRLRIEGLALAGVAAVASAALLLAVDASRAGPWNTVGQLAIVAVALAVLGPRSVRRWAATAEPVTASAPHGEPTPLWQLPVICFGLTALVGAPAEAWDAALRVTGGCLLVGLAQAFLLERTAAREEHRLGGTLVRLPGSRLLSTRLGILRS